MTQKKSQSSNISIYSSDGTRKFGGLKWWWWIVIFIVILLLGIMPLGSILGGLLKGAANGLGALSNGLLGFAGGLLNLLAKNPLVWIFASIYLFPFVGSGLSRCVKLYKEHFGEGKSQTDINKELKIDEDSLAEKIKELQEKNPEKDIKDIVKEALGSSYREVINITVNKEADRLQSKVNNGEFSAAVAQEQINSLTREGNERATEDAKDHGTETEPIEPPKIEPKP